MIGVLVSGIGSTTSGKHNEIGVQVLAARTANL
jgi:hypothetical protein